MTRRVGGILAALRLMRIALVFTAVSNIWLVALWTAAQPDEPATGEVRSIGTAVLLLCTAVVAGGLYVFGMVLNDVMDVRRDRTFAPDRPLPSGQMSVATATGIAVAALLAAIAASVPLGPFSTLIAVTCATLIVFYDGLGKHLPGVGVVTLGLVRAANMVIANPAIGFCWPIWLTMTHVIAVSAAAHRLENKRPRLVGSSLWIVVGGWALATFALVLWMSRRGHLLPVSGWVWVPPAAAVTAYLLMALHVTHTRPPVQAGQTLMRRGLMWLIAYDAAWMLGIGRWAEAAMIGALLPLAFASMWLMRQWSVVRRPVEFEQ